MRYLVACLLLLSTLMPVHAKPTTGANFNGKFAGDFMGGYIIVKSIQRGSSVLYNYRITGLKRPLRGRGTATIKGNTITDGKFTATLKKNSLYFQPPVGGPVQLRRIR